MLYKHWLNMSADLENPEVATRLGRSVLIPIPKKGKPKNVQTTTAALMSQASKVMLKFLQARFQQYMNWELPDIQAGFWKGRGTRDQIVNIWYIIGKAREFQKNICFMDYAEAFDCVDHNKIWKILQEMGIADHLITCLLRNQYAGQEAIARTGHGIKTAGRNISNLRDAGYTIFMVESEEELKSIWWKRKRREKQLA